MYVDSNASKLIVGDINNTEIKDKMVDMVDQLKNPFNDLYVWVKGEIYDINAMLEAIGARDNLDQMKIKLDQKKRNDQAALDKLNQGKKTWKTMLKGSSGKQTEMTNLQNAIANVLPFLIPPTCLIG